MRMASKLASHSPNSIDRVFVESFVAANKRHAFHQGLRCDESIEWVTVMKRQLRNQQDMLLIDVEEFEAV